MIIFTFLIHFMNLQEFFEIFTRELETNPDLRGYYRLLDHPGRFLWRKAYLEQRLQYVSDHLPDTGCSIWDVGCGYGTTAIYACLNGHQVLGTTLEFYFDQIRRRIDYWSRFGDLSGLRIEYENLFDRTVNPQSVDVIILQDTLHHLEPIDQACEILSRALKPGGKLIVSEENGDNPFIRGKNFAKRGFNRVGEIYDELLGKMIPFGNENARNLKTWKGILGKANLRLIDRETRYIRFYPPFWYNQHTYNTIINREYSLGQKNRLLRDFLFFGINFTAESTD
jgi:SAM-dependent methyltransferase